MENKKYEKEELGREEVPVISTDAPSEAAAENEKFPQISEELTDDNAADNEELSDVSECDAAEHFTDADGAESYAENEAEAAEADESSEPEYEPKNRYEKLLYRVYRDDSLAEIIRIASYAIAALTVYAFFSRLVALVETPIEILKILVVTGVPFVAVSILRVLINAPRPYELLEFYKKKPKGKAGHSFPSRHVFSVFVIASVLLTWNPLVGVGLMLLGALLAFLRVALGIHFVRDVVAGGLIGLASGGIGLLVLHFI